MKTPPFPSLLLVATILILILIIIEPGTAQQCSACDSGAPLRDAVDLQWFAPFYAGGGYCSEAVAFATGLDQYLNSTGEGQTGVINSAVIIHHGDSINMNRVLTAQEKSLYARRMKESYVIQNKRKTQRQLASEFPIVSVCHSEPGAWHGEGKYN
jgi:hypothetical protein